MKMRYGLLTITVLLLCTLLLSACSNGPEQDVEQREALAQAFMKDLQDDILVKRNAPKALMETGVLVSEQGKVADAQYLQIFYDSVQAGEAVELTIAFFNPSQLIVARLQFTEEGSGYYFRYELDEAADIAVTAKYINQVELDADGDTGKITLTLKDGRAQIAKFTFQTR